MKICFLAGANSVHSYRWVRYFAEEGHEIYWLSLTPLTVGSSIRNVNFYEIEQSRIKIFSILRAIFPVKKFIKEIEPEILHAHYAGTYGLLGALSGFHPFVVTTWGSDVLFAGKSKIKGFLVKFILNKADLITCDANHMIDAMVKLGTNNEKIRLVNFGVEIDKFQPGEEDENLRAKLGLSNSPTIISLRNLEPIFDIVTLINSIPYVLRDIPEVKFVIAGTGSQERYLKELARSLRVMDSIRFMGRYSNDELPKYLVSADIYVSTSLSDAGISASTAEAMACGLPVIITDSGENRMWVKDGENGFVVPVRKPEILAEKIICLAKNDDMRTRFGRINRKIIEERNNHYVEMGKMESIYEELIGKS